jgi:hypothetical protein
MFGQDEASHGTVRYPVDADSLTRVPPEAVAFLIGKGGFAVPKKPESSVSAGMVRLHHEDAAGCCYDGRRYLGDANGEVRVPAEAVLELQAHGFVPVLPAVSPSKSPKLARGPRLPKD